MRQTHALLAAVVGVAFSLGLNLMNPASAQTSTGAVTCTDGRGPTSAFFCAPRAQGAPVKYYSGVRPIPAMTRIASQSAADQFCRSQGYNKAEVHVVDTAENLAEVLCREPLSPVASTVPSTPPATPPAPVAVPTPIVQEVPPMYNTDLFGGDYREFQLSAGQDWRTCRAACDSDDQCVAWTYVLPGRQQHGECFLKDTVPQRSESGCCISDVKGATGSGSSAAPVQTGLVGGTLGAAGQASEGERSETAADRILREAAQAAEDRATEEARRGVNSAMDRILGR